MNIVLLHDFAVVFPLNSVQLIDTSSFQHNVVVSDILPCHSSSSFSLCLIHVSQLLAPAPDRDTPSVFLPQTTATDLKQTEHSGTNTGEGRGVTVHMMREVSDRS